MSTPELRLAYDAQPKGLKDYVRAEFRVDLYKAERSDPVLAGPACSVKGCEGLYVPNKPGSVCSNHLKRAKRMGLEPHELLNLPSEERGTYPNLALFDFRSLNDPLRLEMQFALQERHDLMEARLAVSAFKTANKVLVGAKIETLTDFSASDLFRMTRHKAVGSWLKFARTRLDLALRPDDIHQRDYWVSSDFPDVKSPSPALRINFYDIEIDWIRDAARRWAEWRLISGLAWGTVHLNVEATKHFSRYLLSLEPPVHEPKAVNRDVAVGFVRYLKESGAAQQSVSDHVSGVRKFLDEYKVRDWGPPLPASAIIRYDDVRAPRTSLPRPVPEFIMRQVESADNMARLPLHLAAMILIGLRCGLRLSSTLLLTTDCVNIDRDGNASLRYRNTKDNNNERAIPILHEDVRLAIDAQLADVRSRYPDGCDLLFPRLHANPKGRRAISQTATRGAIAKWFDECNITDERGEPARITYHQLRHTFATRLLEQGASEYFISMLLDHKSTATTRGYAQLSDRSRRDEFERITKVNNEGEAIARFNDAEAADTQWMQKELNRLQVTLPNGYCGLPPQQPCEMRNACLDCGPYFITTIEFLPTHRAQLRKTRELISQAEECGQDRMAEKNRPVEEKLVKIISKLEREEGGHDETK